MGEAFLSHYDCRLPVKQSHPRVEGTEFDFRYEIPCLTRRNDVYDTRSRVVYSHKATVFEFSRPFQMAKMYQSYVAFSDIMLKFGCGCLRKRCRSHLTIRRAQSKNKKINPLEATVEPKPRVQRNSVTLRDDHAS